MRLRVLLQKDNRLKLAAVSVVAVAAVALTLLRHWEPGHETWTYWFFARVFAETGEFIVPDRSPVYTLYLNIFRWMGFPAAVAVEYLVTSILVVLGLVVLFKRFLGLPMAVFAGLLSLPFLQTSQPPVQMLALAASAWAVAMRLDENGKPKIVGSYSIFLLAWMLRPSSLVFIILFGAWDLFKILKLLMRKRAGTPSSGIRLPTTGALAEVLSPRNGALAATVRRVTARGWPVFLIGGLLIWFNAAQSPHLWNNVWVASAQWFPVSNNSKSLMDVWIIASFNNLYVRDKFGPTAQVDFYLTNDEVFDGADTALGAIKANPKFIFETTAKNTKESVLFFVGLSGVPSIYAKLRLPQWYYFHLFTLIVIIFGAVVASRAPPVLLFLLGSAFIVAVSGFIRPEIQDHYVTFVPILIFSAIWYGLTLRKAINSDYRTSGRLLIGGGLMGLSLVAIYLIGVYEVWRASFSPPLSSTAWSIVIVVTGVSLVSLGLGLAQFVDRARTLASPVRLLFGWAAVPVALILFSTGLTTWPDMLVDIGRDVRDGEVKVLERRDDRSLKVSRQPLQTVTQDCKGVLSSDHAFIGTFLDVPAYDLSELPPFGRLGDSVYDGLRPDRIDCVIVNDYARYGDTNRYERYIEPYVQLLKSMGAVTHDLPKLGQVVVLKDSNR